MSDATKTDLIDQLLEADELDALDLLDDEDRRWLLDELTKRLDEWGFDVPGFRNEKALRAMVMLGKVDWLAYGGAAGGGKTEVGLKHAHDLSLAIDGHSTLILRTSKPELRRSIVFRSMARFRRLKVRAKLRNQENVLAWHYADTGSIMEFGFCSRDDDVGQFLSAEYGFVWFDEATQFSTEQMMSIIGRCRVTIQQQQQGAREHVLFTTNPGSRSHMWFFEFFVQPTAYGEFVLVLDIADGIENAVVKQVLPAPQTVEEAEAFPAIERSDTEVVIGFIPAFVEDNPHLAKSYRRSLLALREVERKQKLYGDWDTYDGQFFDEWRYDIHVVDAFDIPPGWQRARGIDWGYGAPWCCLWGAWSPDGVLHVYRELYGRRVLTEDQAKQAVAASVMVDGGTERPEHIPVSAADPSVFSQTAGTGLSTAQLWGRHGLHVAKAKNHRPTGWNNVRSYLSLDPDTQAPRMVVHRGACPNLIRTLPGLIYSAHNQEDLDTDGEDHACFVAGTMVTTRAGRRRIETVYAGDEVMTRIGWQRVAASGMTGVHEVMRVTFSDGRSLLCTPDHRIWTDAGWLPVSAAVTHSVTVDGWNRAGRSSRRATFDPRPGSVTSTARWPVSVVAVEPSGMGPVPVYNLTVEGAPEFYAEGVLVHNCDALRYLAMIRPIGRRVSTPAHRDGIEGMVDRMFDKMRRRERSSKLIRTLDALTKD